MRMKRWILSPRNANRTPIRPMQNLPRNGTEDNHQTSRMLALATRKQLPSLSLNPRIQLLLQQVITARPRKKTRPLQQPNKRVQAPPNRRMVTNSWLRYHPQPVQPHRVTRKQHQYLHLRASPSNMTISSYRVSPGSTHSQLKSPRSMVAWRSCPTGTAGKSFVLTGTIKTWGVYGKSGRLGL